MQQRLIKEDEDTKEPIVFGNLVSCEFATSSFVTVMGTGARLE